MRYDNADVQGIETAVMVRTVLVKQTSVWCDEGHVVSEWEYDAAEGRRVPAAHWEADDDLSARFREQQRTALQCIDDCARICRQLRSEGHRFYAGVNIFDLACDCEDWDEEEVTVKD